MNKRTLSLWWEYFLSGFKYLLAFFMMFAGVATAFSPVDTNSHLGWLYDSRHALVIYGVIFFGSGFALFWGKIRKSRKWVGRGLLFIYLSFLYGTILNGLAWGFADLITWVPNLLASLLVGALYLRWKFKTEYVNPKHFTRDIKIEGPRP